ETLSQNARRLASLKWPTEVRQHPYGQQVDAQQGLDTGNCAHPAGRFQGEIARLCAAQPRTDAELAISNLKSGQEGEVRRKRGSPGDRSGLPLATHSVLGRATYAPG